MVTFGADGQVSDIEILTTTTCDEEHDGIKYAERETQKTYGKDFELTCLMYPERLGITGNKHSEY